MYLVDQAGKVFTDEENPSQKITTLLASPANDYCRMTLIEEYAVLYRYSENGDLDMYFVGEKPFVKLRLSLVELHTYQDCDEFFRDDVRIARRGDTEAVLYIGDKQYVIPQELLTRW